MKLFRILAVWCFILFATAGIQQVQAQPAESQATVTATTEPEVEMADVLRQDGKIYVVVAVLVTILGGVVAYLISLDRKVSRLEKQMQDDLVKQH